jgi:hypothetical protein
MQMTKLSEMIEKETNQQIPTSKPATPKPITPNPIKTDASTNVLRDFLNRQTATLRDNFYMHLV